MEKPSINDLPDDLLWEILRWVPNFKEIPATMIVSKRWEGVWKLMQDLKFDDESYTSAMSFTSFVNGCLLKNDAEYQVIERLHLKLGRNYPASDINAWVQTAVNRSIREMRIDLIGKTLEVLPSSCLSTCTTLKTLILCDLSIEVIPFLLPSLKNLEILGVRFLCDESAESLLQNCPVLEDLVVSQTSVFNSSYNEESTLSRTCTSLKRLILHHLSIDVVPTWFRLPSLKTLELTSVKFPVPESAASLVQIWPSIEDLAVNQTKVINSMSSGIMNLRLLILKEISIEVVPPQFRMPSLRVLHLLSVRFAGEESVVALLKSFSALEVLVVNKTEDDNVMIFNISVHSLRILSIDNSKGKRGGYVEGISHGFVIDTPLLRKLKFRDTFSNFIEFEYMPKLVKADIEVIRGKFEDKFMGISFTSVKQLSICSPSAKTPYPRDTVFHFLTHVELCTCSAGWWSLLADILTDSPKLVSLKLMSQHSARCPLKKKEKRSPRNSYNHDWPICLSSTKLEILEWRQYEGTEQEMKVAKCILANATCLKMATFSPRFGNKYNNMCRKLQKLHRVVGAEDLEAGTYSTSDIVLPLPGSRVIYPSNDIAEVYHDLAKKDGISLTESTHAVKEFSITSMTGGYRRVFQKPIDFEWELLAYTDSNKPLAETDLDRITIGKPRDKAEEIELVNSDCNPQDAEQTQMALKMALTLPSSCYATMAIRELLKTSTSVAYHKTLN